MNSVKCSEMCESSAGAAAGIQAIDKGSVHRICSGQVILNLATAIKELVENSIDAGATSVEVRLKDYGSELLEVIDNGSGVESENFAGLTLKHHTSKLKDFTDLVNVDTFGFRGEALSSLCALSKLSIITCHESAVVGTKLEYDNNGKICKQTPCARQKGTTVSVENLFSTLPVRHKEFQRNIKKEFSKAIQVLNAYCIISTGIRITCTNQTGAGKKNIVISTGGNATVRENITNIFGAKQGQSLLDITQAAPTEEVCTEYNIKNQDDAKNTFEISGYISSSEHGQGRSSSDRQFFFINSRPCDPQKISRLVNEVYHMYNRLQYPFITLNMALAKESVDVNVTPDKRQIFIQQERLLLGVIKTSLMKVLEPKSSVYRVSQGTIGLKNSTRGFASSFSRKSPVKSPEVTNKKSLSSSLSNLKRSFSSAFSKDSSSNDGSTCEAEPKQRKLDSFIMVKESGPVEPLPSDTTADDSSSTSGNISRPNSQADNDSDSNTCSESKQSDSQTSGLGSMDIDPLTTTDSEIPSGMSELGTNLTNYSNLNCEDTACKNVSEKELCVVNPDKISCEDESQNCDNLKEDTPSEPVTLEIKFESLDSVNMVSDTKSEQISSNMSQDSLILEAAESLVRIEHFQPSHDMNDENENSGKIVPLEKDEISHSNKESLSEKTIENPSSQAGTDDLQMTFTEFDNASSSGNSKQTNVTFSMDRLRESLRSKTKKSQSTERECRSFRARINPQDNQAAEDELQKEISKDMFTKMEILGQFNLGFIIAKLGRDLFIIDQHATDEKYNFETLQRETVIQGQKLIQPQNLELTAANECILMDNLEIFRKNGFEFVVNEDGLPTQRVRLVTMPVSKNWTFGKDDIEELIFMLSDSPGVMCRPSRVRQMFASRACRKSIMIGTALSKAEMTKLVTHMSEIDQPWNCPHGRPTMRHLINLDMLPD